jgi:hypothetical protein
MKIQRQTEQQQEKEFALNLSFEEHLRFHNLQPSDDALNDMERVFCKATILKHHKQPLNNINYNNLQGA